VGSMAKAAALSEAPPPLIQQAAATPGPGASSGPVAGSDGRSAGGAAGAARRTTWLAAGSGNRPITVPKHGRRGLGAFGARRRRRRGKLLRRTGRQRRVSAAYSVAQQDTGHFLLDASVPQHFRVVEPIRLVLRPGKLRPRIGHQAIALPGTISGARFRALSSIGEISAISVGRTSHLK